MAASGQIRVAAHIRVAFRGVTSTNLRLALVRKRVLERIPLPEP
jgi:hypothetical protein